MSKDKSELFNDLDLTTATEANGEVKEEHLAFYCECGSVSFAIRKDHKLECCKCGLVIENKIWIENRKMKLSDKEYEQIKAWYCKYRGIKDEPKCWNQTIIIGGKYTHSDEIEVLQDFFESFEVISNLNQKILDQIEIIQCLTEKNEMLNNSNYCNCKNNNYSYGNAVCHDCGKIKIIEKSKGNK